MPMMATGIVLVRSRTFATLSCTMVLLSCSTVAAAELSATQVPTSMRCVKATAKGKGGDDFSHVVYSADCAVPTPSSTEVLIGVRASSVNPVDWKILSGGFGARFPHVLGFDVAGVVVAVGSGCRRLKVGDAVWADLGKFWPLRGGELGAYAEYAIADEAQVGLKPRTMSFIDAASIPLVALTTLQSFRQMGLDTHGANSTVVITSGSGGTGAVAIQMAKAYGAQKVITACGTTTQAFCAELGADVVVDYHKGKSALWNAAGKDSVDFVYDNYGAKGTADLAMPSLRSPGGVFLLLPGKDAKLSAHPRPGVKQINFGLCDSSDHADLDALGALADAGHLAASVSHTFPLERVVAAFNVSYAGGAVGKLGICMNEPCA